MCEGDPIDAYDSYSSVHKSSANKLSQLYFRSSHLGNSSATLSVAQPWCLCWKAKAQASQVKDGQNPTLPLGIWRKLSLAHCYLGKFQPAHPLYCHLFFQLYRKAQNNVYPMYTPGRFKNSSLCLVCFRSLKASLLFLCFSILLIFLLSLWFSSLFFLVFSAVL